TLANMGGELGNVIFVGTKEGDRIKIISADEQGTLLAEIANTGETKKIILSDFNQDGSDDVLVVNLFGQPSNIYYYQQSLEYTAEENNVEFSYGAEGLISDVNNDNWLDISITGQSFNVVTYTNLAGQFTIAPDIYTSEQQIITSALDTVNGFIMLATDKTLQVFEFKEGNAVQNGAAVVIAARNISAKSVHVKNSAKESNSGGKQRLLAVTAAVPATGVTDIEVADLDGDNQPEFIVASSTSSNNSGNVSTEKGLKSVQIMAPKQQSLEVLATMANVSVTDIVIADIDGDNKPDLLLKTDNGTTQVYKNKGEVDNFEQQETVIAARASIVLAADIDGDGLADVITYNEEGGDLDVFISNINGSFGPQVDLALSADMNFVFANFNTEHNTIFYSTQVSNNTEHDTQSNTLNIVLTDGIEVTEQPDYCLLETGTQLSCDLSKIIAGNSRSSLFVFAGALVNADIQIQHFSSAIDPDLSNNQLLTQFSQYQADISVISKIINVSEKDETLNYQAVVTNHSDITMTNAKVFLSLPPGFGYLQTPAECNRINPEKERVEFECLYGTLLSLQSVTVQFKLKSNQQLNQKDETVQAKVVADIVDTNSTNNKSAISTKDVLGYGGKSTSSSKSKSAGSFSIFLLALCLLITWLRITSVINISKKRKKQKGACL
ncbi:MAG: VCBS repeat-containing protein, partial [Colwellia sp.]